MADSKHVVRDVMTDGGYDFKTDDGKSIAMSSYKILFEDMYDESRSALEQTLVNFSQKADKAAPKKGDEMEGSIDMSAKNGPRFKKAAGSGGSGWSGGGAARAPADPKTMYVSYAKDIIVAMLDAGMLKGITFPELIEQVADEGKRLQRLADTEGATPPAKTKEQLEIDKIFDKK